MRKTLRNISLFLILIFAGGCGQKSDRTQIDIANGLGSIEIKKYGDAIFSMDTANLQQNLKDIKPNFPLFLDGDLDDPGTIKKMRDFITDEKLIGIHGDCKIKFSDLDWLEEELGRLIDHYLYYFPDNNIPDIYTYVSGFDYEFRTQFYNNNLLIALDMYLGQEYPSYQQLGVPQYVIRQFQPRYIAKDCAYEIGRSGLMYRKLGNHLIDFMINEGKLLYFVKSMIPDIDEGVLFDYPDDQLNWIRNNEGLVWAFIIENEVLYSSEPDYMQKFIMDGPFTSFFGNESPPRLGAFIGYRLVESYMQHNPDVGLEHLMREYDPREILKRSKYKPE